MSNGASIPDWFEDYSDNDNLRLLYDFCNDNDIWLGF